MGATDHSMPYMDDFLTFKELQKPVKVWTAGKECIFFTGIGTIVFTILAPAYCWLRQAINAHTHHEWVILIRRQTHLFSAMTHNEATYANRK